MRSCGVRGVEERQTIFRHFLSKLLQKSTWTPTETQMGAKMSLKGSQNWIEKPIDDWSVGKLLFPFPSCWGPFEMLTTAKNERNTSRSSLGWQGRHCQLFNLILKLATGGWMRATFIISFVICGVAAANICLALLQPGNDYQRDLRALQSQLSYLFIFIGLLLSSNVERLTLLMSKLPDYGSF